MKKFNVALSISDTVRVFRKRLYLIPTIMLEYYRRPEFDGIDTYYSVSRFGLCVMFLNLDARIIFLFRGMKY